MKKRSVASDAAHASKSKSDNNINGFASSSIQDIYAFLKSDEQGGGAALPGRGEEPSAARRGAGRGAAGGRGGPRGAAAAAGHQVAPRGARAALREPGRAAAARRRRGGGLGRARRRRAPPERAEEGRAREPAHRGPVGR